VSDDPYIPELKFLNLDRGFDKKSKPDKSSNYTNKIRQEPLIIIKQGPWNEIEYSFQDFPNVCGMGQGSCRRYFYETLIRSDFDEKKSSLGRTPRQQSSFSSLRHLNSTAILPHTPRTRLFCSVQISTRGLDRRRTYNFNEELKKLSSLKKDSLS